MKTISGQFPHKGKLKDFSFKVAENWQELQPMQFARILQLLTYQKADPYTLRASFISILCGHENFPVIAALDEDDLTGMLPLIDFIFNTRPQVCNKFQTINLNKKKCLAPAEDLSNIGFGEWCFAYQFYQLYYEFGNEAYLNQLIACLYRPADPAQTEENPDFTGDSRLKFNENLIAKNAKSVEAVEMHIKHAILVWFSTALLSVMDDRPHVFPPADPKAVRPDESVETKEDPTNWLTIFRELLGAKWGTTEQLKHTNAMFVLDGLEEQHIAFAEAKSQVTA